jgi:hypothetical protein
MDRPIITSAQACANAHYISPGGYEIETKNGKHIRFDFMSTGWCVDKNNRCLIDIDVDTYDDDYAENEIITPEDIKDAKWLEFYIYTGEYDDPVIYPVKVYDIEFAFMDDKGNVDVYDCTPEMTAQINDDCIKPQLDEKSKEDGRFEYAVETYDVKSESFVSQIDVFTDFDVALKCVKESDHSDKTLYYGILSIEYDGNDNEIGTDRTWREDK